MPTTSARLLALLSLLQARRDWPAATLAARLDVTDRTVRRDVDRLRELGYPIASTRGRDGGYRLEAGSSMPPLLLDDEQAVALAVALRAAATSGVDIAEAAGRALLTVQQVLPARLRHRVDALPATTLTRRTDDLVDPQVLTPVGSAVRAREVLRFDYATPPTDREDGGDRTDEVADAAAGHRRTRPVAAARRVEPHHLVARDGRWYLVAWDLDRDDWRTYRVDRVRPRTPAGARFAERAVPGGDVAAFVTARFRGAGDGSGTAWPCEGTAVLDAPASRIAPFAHDGTVRDLGDGRSHVTIGSWSWVGLAASFARFDAEMTAVRPPALAVALDQLAARLRRAAAGSAG